MHAVNGKHSVQSRVDKTPLSFVSVNLDLDHPSIPRPAYLNKPRHNPKPAPKSGSDEDLVRAKETYQHIMSSLEENRSQNPHLLLPPLSFPSLDKSGKVVRSGKEESERSEHVMALRSALRPVRLQRPRELISESPDRDGMSRRLVSTPQFLHQTSEVRRASSLEREESFVDSVTSDARSTGSENHSPPSKIQARDLIANIWDGYALQYPRGKAASPKWQKVREAPVPEKTRNVPLPRHEPLPVKDNIAWSKPLDSPRSPAAQHSSRRAVGNGLPGNMERDIRTPEAAMEKTENRMAKDRVPKVKPVPNQVPQRAFKSTALRDTDIADDVSMSSEKTWTVPPQQQPRPRSITTIPLPADPPRPQSARSRIPPHPKHQPTQSRLRARSTERYKAQREEQETSDLLELKKQFRAKPIPNWINERKYEDLVTEAEKRKRRVEERARALLEQTQPFDFVRGRVRRSDDEKRRSSQEGRETDGFVKKRKGGAGAGRMPLTAPPAMVSTAEQRQQDFLRSTLVRKGCNKHLPPDPTFQPNINHSVPDFARLHADLDKKRENYRLENRLTTVPQPFKMHFLQSTPSKEPESRPRSHSADRVSRPRINIQDQKAFEELVRPTRAFLLKTDFSRQKLEEDKRSGQLPEEDALLAERVRESLAVRDQQLRDKASTVAHHEHKVVDVSDAEREREYLDRLAEVKRRLSERPFIWQRNQMEERRKRIEARFQEILRDDAVEEAYNNAVNPGASLK